MKTVTNYKVFDQTKFHNLPKELRNKLNAEVAEHIKRLTPLYDVAKCNHSEEKLRIIRRKSGGKVKVQCRCGKVYEPLR